MKYRYLLAAALLLGIGCAAEDKSQWDEFWKDLRGDNRKMQTDSWGRDPLSEKSLKTTD